MWHYKLGQSGQKNCIKGMEVLCPEECKKAFNQIKQVEHLTPARSMKIGSWNNIMPYCSVETSGDDTLYYNKRSKANEVWKNKMNKNNQKICRIQGKFYLDT